MTDAAQAVKAEIEELNEDLNERFQLIDDWEERIKSLEDSGGGTADLKEKVHKAATEVSEKVDEIKSLRKELQERQDEFETKMQEEIKTGAAGANGRGGTDLRAGLKAALDEAGVSAHNQGKASFSFESWDDVSGGGRAAAARAAAKAITDLAGSGGDLLNQQRVPGIVSPGQRQLRIRNLLPTAQTSEASVEYMEETSVTDNAQTQAAQGDLKGESDFVFNLASERVITVAHFLKISTQMLSDVPALESYVRTRMRFLLDQEEEDQLLNGSGTNELNGLKTQATAYNTSLDDNVTAMQELDVIRAAMLQVALAHYSPTGIVVHPTTWFDIETTKDGHNNYLFVNPQTGAMPRLWGLPVVSTTAQTTDEFTVGAFQLGAQLWDRMMARVLVSTEDDDNFQRNLATLRAEKREALTVYRPESFVDGDFSVAITGS